MEQGAGEKLNSNRGTVDLHMTLLVIYDCEWSTAMVPPVLMHLICYAMLLKMMRPPLYAAPYASTACLVTNGRN